MTRRLVARLAKLLRSNTIQTTAYTQPEINADEQGHMEPVRLGHDSTDVYPMLHPGEQTQLDTEPAGTNLGGADETTPRRCHSPRLLETCGNNRPRTMRISTNSGSLEAAMVPQTLAACVTITPGRALSLSILLSSRVPRYSSPLAVPRTTRSGIRSSSPPGEPSTRRTVSV